MASRLQNFVTVISYQRLGSLLYASRLHLAKSTRSDGQHQYTTLSVGYAVRIVHQVLSQPAYMQSNYDNKINDDRFA